MVIYTSIKMKSSIVPIIIQSLYQIDSRTSERMPASKFFDAVRKTAVIFPVSLNLVQKQYQDVQLELLEDRTKFQSGQLKSV